MVNLSFNVGLAQPYEIPLQVGGTASTTAAASGSATSPSSTAQGASGDTVTISPTAQLLQASANAALLAAVMGGTAAVSYSVDTASSSSTSSTASPTAPGASALAQLEKSDPATAARLSNALTLLQGQSGSGG